jgi:hypothetical protein
MNARESSQRSRRQWEALAKSRLRRSEAAADVEDALVAEGLGREAAEEVVDSAIRRARASAIRLLIGGVAFAALGLIVTVASFFSAAVNGDGGTYLIWFGPVICGGIAALVGFVRLMSIGT